MVNSLLKSAIHLGSLIMVDSANQTDGDTAVIDREVQRVRKISPKYKVLPVSYTHLTLPTKA